MHEKDLCDDTKQNLLELMKMGFTNFKQNITLLKKHKNNLLQTVNKLCAL